MKFKSSRGFRDPIPTKTKKMISLDGSLSVNLSHTKHVFLISGGETLVEGPAEKALRRAFFGSLNSNLEQISVCVRSVGSKPATDFRGHKTVATTSLGNVLGSLRGKKDGDSHWACHFRRLWRAAVLALHGKRLPGWCRTN